MGLMPPKRWKSAEKPLVAATPFLKPKLLFGPSHQRVQRECGTASKHAKSKHPRWCPGNLQNIFACSFANHPSRSFVTIQKRFWAHQLGLCQTIAETIASFPQHRLDVCWATSPFSFNIIQPVFSAPCVFLLVYTQTSITSIIEANSCLLVLRQKIWYPLVSLNLLVPHKN